MTNIAITLNFGNTDEAAEMFEAFAAALRQMGARARSIADAVGDAVDAAADALVGAAPVAPATHATPAQEAPAQEAPAPTTPAPRRLRRSRSAAPVAAAPVAAAPVTAAPVAAAPVAAAPVAAAPVAAAPVAAAPVAGSLPRPAALTLDTMRAYLQRLLQDQRPGRGTPAGLALLAQYAPAGDKRISSVPADSYPAMWDSISAALDGGAINPLT